MPTLWIKLANGTMVTADEFYTWGAQKQNSLLVPMSEETKKKMSQAKLGKRKSAATRQAMSDGSKEAWVQRQASGTAKHTQATKEKIGAATRGKKLGPKSTEQKAKLSASKLKANAAKKAAGIVTTISDEHRAAISASRKAYWEAKRAASPPKTKMTLKPKTKSAETKAKMSAARSAYWAQRRAEKELINA